MPQKTSPLWATISLYLFYGLLAYAPLHMFLSAWVGTSFGVYKGAKIALDIVMAAGFLLAVGVSLRRPGLWKSYKDKLIWLIGAYAVLTVGLALLRPTDQDAEILGIVYNLRFLVFFCYALVLAKLFDTNRLRRTSVKIVLVMGAVVVGFGLFQFLLLPNDALTHVGYKGIYGIQPAYFIDDNQELEQVMSTIRDPSSLGAYLIIIAPLAATILFLTRDRRLKQMISVFLVLTALCLWFTFSRSAWFGFALAMVVFFLLTDSKYKIDLYKQRTVLIPLIVLAVVLGVGSLVLFKNSYLVQNVIFKPDKSTVLQNPSDLREIYWEDSLQELAAVPLGNGPGTAGLASIHNQVQGFVLNVNYYLQIAWEAGIIGLALLFCIFVIVAWRLLEMRHDSYVAAALFSAFIGLALVNLLIPIWTNEAVAYTWWGLAGLALASAKSRKHAQARLSKS